MKDHIFRFKLGRPGLPKKIKNKTDHLEKPGTKMDSYSAAGVDLDRAGKTIELIKKPVSSTFTENVLNDLTSFAGLYSLNKDRFKEPVLVSSTDGVGTKLIVAKDTGVYDSIGQDLVGMCINDILCCGATPLFFLDYIACGKINSENIEVIVSSIAKSCRYCETALIGGELAEMPGMYTEDDIDIAGFAVGVVEKADIIRPEMVSAENIIMGIPSSGVHSNGFSLIRKIIKDCGLDLGQKYEIQGVAGRKETLGRILLTPTRLYFEVLKKIRSLDIKLNGIAHITGGGFFENINRVIPGNVDAEINRGSWEIPGIFRFLQKNGRVDDREMFRVFNMGIGMILITDKAGSKKIRSSLSSIKEKIYKIGIIKKGTGKVVLR